MKIPRKKELQELQNKYHTDRKIGEAYGVPSRLVTYWRLKKNIGPYKKPKYSREKITEVWNRFGDDRRAGRELGISDAGFRRWRMQYVIKQRPPQIHLEQLELDLVDVTRKNRSSRRETFVQKILARKASLKAVDVGQSVVIEPDLVVAVDNAAPAIDRFYKNSDSRVWDHLRIAIILNHLSLPNVPGLAEAHKKIREFVKKQGISAFYDIGWGISHQVVIEERLILPGQVALGTDPHAAAYGCLGAYSLNIPNSEMADIWYAGKAELVVPRSVKIIIEGNLSNGVSTCDVILRLNRDVNQIAASGKVIEYYGRVVAGLTIPQRFSLTNFAVGAGVRAAVIPCDEITQKYFRRKTKAKFRPIKADDNAAYDDEIELNISYLTPQVISPRGPDDVRPVEEVSGKRLDHVVIGGCSSGSLEDLAVAALILRGRRINRRTRLVIIPGSQKTYLKALDDGYIRTFIESGCLVLSPSCGSCLSANNVMIADGERALTTTNGSARCIENGGNLEIYVASPATAAASALEGAITDPRKYLL